MTTSQHPAVLVPGLKRLLKGSWEQKRWFALAVLGATAAPLVYVSTPDGDDYWWDLRTDKIEEHFGRTAAA